ncbi:hypothetical protein IMZ48_12840 [Candidatus Bathyarchaeota archaeon]|nr:hypothetical protein [Candidatus Bathyarchaeota archaeon]
MKLKIELQEEKTGNKNGVFCFLERVAILKFRNAICFETTTGDHDERAGRRGEGGGRRNKERRTEMVEKKGGVVEGGERGGKEWIRKGLVSRWIFVEESKKAALSL